MIAFIVFVCLLLFSEEVMAEDRCNLILSGKVIDEHDQSPLENAAVFIKGTNNGTYSDSTGAYVLTGVCQGQQTIIIQHLGCEDFEKVVDLATNLSLDFYLEHHEEELKEIVVKANQLLYETPSQSSTTLKGENYRNNADENLGKLLENVTGVTSLNTGSGISKPVIQGVTGNRILMLNNGIKLESQQWGAEHAPEIDPFASSSATVIKGAGAVRYGTDALGGVILVESSPLPIKNQIKGESYFVYKSNGKQWLQSHSLEGGLKKEGWGWRIQGSYKRGGDQQAPEYNLTNTGMQEGGASLAIGYKKFRYGYEASYNFYHNDMGILRSAHIGNLTDLHNALESDTPLIIEPFTYQINSPRQQVDHHMAKLKGYYRIQENLKLSVQYSAQVNNRKEFDIRRGGRSDIPALDMQLSSHFFESILEHQEIGNWTGSSGISILHQYNYNQPGTGVKPLVPDYSSHVASIYHLEKYARQKWEVEAGIRYEYNHLLAKRINDSYVLVKPEFNYHNFAITTGFIVRPGDYFHFKTNIGGYSRSPQANELYSEGLHHSAAAIEYGDSTLQEERGVKVIMDIDGKIKSIFRWNIVPHTALVNNYIYLIADSVPELTVRGAFPVFRYTQTRAVLYGADFELAVKPHPTLETGIRASVVKGRDTQGEQWLNYMPADRIEPWINYTQSIKTKHTLNLSTQVPYVFRQKNYEPSLDVAPPPDGYVLWNISAGYTVGLKKLQLHTGLEIENILNTSYRDYMNRLRYYADNTGRNISIKLHISY